MSPPPLGGKGGDSLFLTDSVTGSAEYGSGSAGTVFLSISRRKPGRPCTIAFSMCPLSTKAAIWLRTLRSVCLVFAEIAACEGQHSPVSLA